MLAQQCVLPQKNLHFGGRQSHNLTAQNQFFRCWHTNTPWIMRLLLSVMIPVNFSDLLDTLTPVITPQLVESQSCV